MDNINDTVAGYREDIRIAVDSGLDAWALNFAEWPGTGPPYRDKMDRIYEAAKSFGDRFHLFLCADMSTGGPIGEPEIYEMTARYAPHPNQLYIGGKMVFNTFAGHTRTFGEVDFRAGWAKVINGLTSRGTPVFFLPSFFSAPSVIGQLDFIDSYVRWDSFPTGNTTYTYAANDAAYADPLLAKGKTYTAGSAKLHMMGLTLCRYGTMV